MSEVVLPCRIRYGRPPEAAAFLEVLRQQQVEEGDLVDFKNHFNEDRIIDSEEALFLEGEHGEVLALAIIHKNLPQILSYYTVSRHRNRGHGQRLLSHCIQRIGESTGGRRLAIAMEPTNYAAWKNVTSLPEALRSQLLIRDDE